MDLYHIWCDLAQGVGDLEFCRNLEAYLGRLRSEKKLETYRITRKKLGLAPAHLGEFHIVIETRDLEQLEQAFQWVAAREGEVEGLHAAVNQAVRNATFALYRDFPDSIREEGEERF